MQDYSWDGHSTAWLENDECLEHSYARTLLGSRQHEQLFLSVCSNSVFLSSSERIRNFAGCCDPTLQNARLVFQVVLHSNVIGSGLWSTFSKIALDWFMYLNCSVFLFITAPLRPRGREVSLPHLSFYYNFILSLI